MREQQWRIGALLVSPQAHTVSHEGELLVLRPLLWGLLRTLLSPPNALHTTEALCAACWPHQVPASKKLGNLVSELRMALGKSPEAAASIVTVPRLGYLLRATLVEAPTTAAPRSQTERNVPLASDSQAPEWFVGRSAEREALLRSLDDPGLHRKQVTLVTGPQGIGKSAFLDVCTVAAEQRGQWTILRGAAPRPLGLPEPFAPWLQAIRTYARQGGRLPDIERVSEFAPAWVAALPGVFGPEATAKAHLHLPGLTELAMRLQGMDLLERWSRARPMIIVFDDVQWFDSASMSLLISALSLSGASRLEFWLSATEASADEPRTAPAFEMELDLLAHLGPVQLVRLETLNEPEARDYLTRRLRDPALARRLAGRMHAASGGLPLMLSNLVGAVADSESAAAADEPIVRAASAGIADVLRQRLRSLPQDACEVLDGLSCMAGAAPAGVLAMATQLGDARTLAALSVLAVRKLCAEIGPAESGATAMGPVFRMDHSLHADILRDDLTPDRRVLLSSRLADAIEHFGLADPRSGWAAQAAFVYANAGRHADAARVLRGIHAAHQTRFSAQQSKKALMNVLDQLDRALESPGATELRMEVLHDLIDLSAVHSGHEGPSLLEFIEQIERCARTLASPRARYLASHAACIKEFRTGHADRALMHLGPMLSAAHSLGALELAQARLLEGSVLRSAGKIRESSTAWQSLPDFSTHGSGTPGEALLLQARVMIHWNACMQGDLDRGFEGLAAVRREIDDAGRPYLKLLAEFWTGSVLRHLYCLDAASRHLREALRLGSVLRTQFLQFECMSALQACRPPADRDRTLLEQLADPARSLLPTWASKIAARLLADTAVAQGDLSTANTIALRTRGDLVSFALYAPDVHRLDGDIAWAAGRWDDAIDAWRMALREARAQGHEAAALQVAVRCMDAGLPARSLGTGTLQHALSGLLSASLAALSLAEFRPVARRLRSWLGE